MAGGCFQFIKILHIAVIFLHEPKAAATTFCTVIFMFRNCWIQPYIEFGVTLFQWYAPFWNLNIVVILTSFSSPFQIYNFVVTDIKCCFVIIRVIKTIIKWYRLSYISCPVLLNACFLYLSRSSSFIRNQQIFMSLSIHLF